jgi:hypothetical protein
LREGLFTGVCPILLEPETLEAEQLIVGGHLLIVTFGDPTSMCNGNAGVLASWEEATPCANRVLNEAGQRADEGTGTDA